MRCGSGNASGISSAVHQYSNADSRPSSTNKRSPFAFPAASVTGAPTGERVAVEDRLAEIRAGADQAMW